MAGDLTAILQVAAGKSQGQAGKPRPVDERTLRHAAESVSTLSNALEIGSTPSTGQVNIMLMRKEQLERRATMLEEQIQGEDANIKRLRERLLEERARKADKGGVFADVEMARRLRRQIARLEKDVASQRGRLDTLSSRSESYARRINKHREVSVARKEVFGKVRESLLAARARVVDALQEANEVQEDGDAIRQEMDELVEMNDEERRAHAGELAKIDADIKAVSEGKFESVEFVKEAEEDGPGSGDLTEEEEKKLRERIVHLDEQMKAVEQDIRGLYEQTSQLQEIFQLMLKRAGLTTLDDLIDMFSGEESYKYEQYGYVQRLNKELKSLEVQLAAVISEKEGVRHLIAKQDAKRRENLAVTRAEGVKIREQVREQGRALRARQRMCECLTVVSLDVYRAGGGANPTVTGLGVLAGVDAKGNAIQPDGESKEEAEPRTGKDFELTDGTMRTLMSAVESQVSEVTTVFTNLLQMPEQRDVIIEAAKRPGSARPLSRSERRRAREADGQVEELPAVPRVEVARMVTRFKAGPLGKPKDDGLGGLFRLPGLAGPTGGGSRPIIGMLSAPSVEEVNMDDEDDGTDVAASRRASAAPEAMVRPVRRHELSASGALLPTGTPKASSGTRRESGLRRGSRRKSPPSSRRRQSSQHVRLGSRTTVPTTPIRASRGSRA